LREVRALEQLGIWLDASVQLKGHRERQELALVVILLVRLILLTLKIRFVRERKMTLLSLV
jgi:hypothetical protein